MKPKLIAAAAALSIMGLVGGATADAWTLPTWLQRNTTTAQVTAKAPGTLAADTPAVSAATSPEPLPNYRNIVRNEGPAVVGVTVSGLHESANSGPGSGAQGGPMDQDPFYRFFRGVPGFGMAPEGPAPFRGQGSGVIASADGLILTNAHVVRDAKRVTVKLSDRREFSAKVLGSDPATDIAVLKIDAHDLHPAKMGNSEAVQVGDYVLAIGAPYGFEQTATQGIISAKGRSLPGDAVVPFIQTDAAVNPGNSGGPLFDAAGRVIGINAQIYSRSGGFQGLAFAIPISVALRVKDQIVQHGRVEHARMGVTVQDLSATLAESFGLEAPNGALVSSVAPGSAAAQAGLRAGDVITSLNGKPVQTASDVSTRVGQASPGDQLALSLWRNKKEQKVDVTLGRAENEGAATAAQAEGGSLGLALRPLDKAELQSAGVDHGLLIERVSGPAQMAGVQPGDVLLALNGQSAKGVEQIRNAMSKHPKAVALLIRRDGQEIFIPVELG